MNLRLEQTGFDPPNGKRRTDEKRSNSLSEVRGTFKTMSFWSSFFPTVTLSPSVKLTGIILGQKLVIASILLFFPALFQMEYERNALIDAPDSGYYMKIAAHGYAPNGAECAFYPLWPFCIRMGSYFTGGNMMIASCILANIFSLIALLLLHHLVFKNFGPQLAYRAVILLAFYPGSIFFVLPYSESLFLLLLIAFFLGIDYSSTPAILTASLLLPMTRAIGIFVLPVMLWEFFRNRSHWRRYMAGIAPLLGYLLYFATMNWFTGNPFEGFISQKYFPAQPSITKLADPLAFFRSFADFDWSHDMLHSYLDRFVFVLFLASLFWVIRNHSGYYVFAILAGVIPAFSNWMMSYTRFLSIVFPFFIAISDLCTRRSTFLIITLIFAGGQIYFALRLILGQWVG